MNTKLRFQVGPGAPSFSGRQGPCGLNPALLGEIPPMGGATGGCGEQCPPLLGPAAYKGYKGAVQ